MSRQPRVRVALELPALEHTMENRCSYCGLSVSKADASCPLCGTRLITVNLRRALLWTLVAEEYLLVAVMMLRFR